MVDPRRNLEYRGGGALDSEAVTVEDAAVERLARRSLFRRGGGGGGCGAEAVQRSISPLERWRERIHKPVERIAAGAVVVEGYERPFREEEGVRGEIAQSKDGEAFGGGGADGDEGV